MDWLQLQKESRKMLRFVMLSASNEIALFKNCIVILTPEMFLKVNLMKCNELISIGSYIVLFIHLDCKNVIFSVQPTTTVLQKININLYIYRYIKVCYIISHRNLPISYATYAPNHKNCWKRNVNA